MTAVYLESSAVLTWLFGEPDAAQVIRTLNEAEAVATSVLTVVEVERAIRRAVAQRVIKEVAAHKLRGMVAQERSKWITMSLTADVLTRAGQAFPIEPVRTLDAIHLATALAFAEALPDLRMLTLDRRILDNAAALGLA
jgi:predicted nucleic acid-binding protein